MVSFTAFVQVLWLAYTAGLQVAETFAEEPAKNLELAVTLEPSQTTTPATKGEPNDVSILKQINKVNDDGSYTFGYEASDGSFKVETRDVAGNVKGMFGFVDETGLLKRVSYSANNSSGFQATGSSTSSSPDSVRDPMAETPSIQTIPSRKKDEGDEPKSVGVKKVLVSKRPVLKTQQDEMDLRREGNDLRRQLPRNDDGDAPDVYGIHGRSSLQSAPVSPVVSALMSELHPIRASYKTTIKSLNVYDKPEPEFDRQDTVDRLSQQDEEPPQYRPIPVQYHQQLTTAAYPQPTYPVLPPIRYQQHQSVMYPNAYGLNLIALRDELMELILSFVQTRVSQLMSIATYHHQPPPYPMPYQQPNYYVPSYYQGPRVQGSSKQPVGVVVQQQDDYAADQQQSSPKVTQTLKDGLIRMLLSTSPLYDAENLSVRSTPRLAYRRTTQSTPVRNVQIIDDDIVDSRPVTTETPD